eukprot:INCI4363.1.p2 GENE.INCI4363.1~~INCI4363.1.p2  ORF type:complete len:181 (+),score=45.11 INCI4363.1:71-613(+)
MATEIEMTKATSGQDAPSRVNTIDEPRRVGTLSPNYDEDREFRAHWRSNIKAKDENTEQFISEMKWTHDEARGIIIREKGWIQAKPGYVVCCCNNSVGDVFIILGLFVLLYAFFSGWYAMTWYFFLELENDALWVFFGLFVAYFLVVFGTVFAGYVDSENAARAEEEAEAAALKAKRGEA